ncbi:MAG: glutathione transferase GstA [Pseudomonadota bacterium]
MKLYYKAGACSLASHIALHETGVSFEIEAVDTAVGTTASGADYRKINPKGYVPALALDDGAVLTENPAVLQFIADRRPEAKLAPEARTFDRARLNEALNWTSSELHKAFSPLFDAAASDAMREDARTAVARKFDLIEAQLSDGREWLVAGEFSVADAYLFTVANWANFTGIDLARWPRLAAFVSRVATRPAAQKALRAEGLVQ